MPVKIACPKCSKKYTLPDSAVGKAVKCKACETTFRTKMPAGAAPASPQPGKPVQQKPRQQKPKPAQPVSPNLNEFGIDGGFQQEADIFGSPTQGSIGLDNFAEEDIFGESVDPIVLGPSGAAEAPPENPFQSVMTNSSMRGSSARNKARKKKRSKGSADVSAYGVVRMGMVCVFGAGAGMLFVTFAMLIMSVAGLAQPTGEPGPLDAVLVIVNLLLLALGAISWLVLIVGQIMCMFAPNGNERFNAIGAAALAFFSMVGGVVITLVLGVAIFATAGPSGPSATEAATFSIGAIVVFLFCGLMIIVAMFLFVNFYRRVGKNINSSALVKVSYQAMIAICVGLALPFLRLPLAFALAFVGVEQESTTSIMGAFTIFNSLLSLVVAAVILRMVWTGISSLKPG